MLVLGRKRGEGLEVDLGEHGYVRVYVYSVGNGRVRLLVDAPREYHVGRVELPEKEGK